MNTVLLAVGYAGAVILGLLILWFTLKKLIWLIKATPAVAKKVVSGVVRGSEWFVGTVRMSGILGGIAGITLGMSVQLLRYNAERVSDHIEENLIFIAVFAVVGYIAGYYVELWNDRHSQPN